MRLDANVYARGVTSSRSQAENYIKLGLVRVNDKVIKKPSFAVSDRDKIELIGEQ